MIEQSNLPIPATSGILMNTAGCIVFWSFRDTTASSGSVFALYDGDTAGGVLLLPATTIAGQSFRDTIVPHTLRFGAGLFYQLVSGTITGMVSVLTRHECLHALTDQADRMAGSP